MIAAITPTHDRPHAMTLCAKWLSAQTRKPDLWIVADDGEDPWEGATVDGVEIIHAKGEPTIKGHLSLIANVRRALPLTAGASVVVMIEDDDAYKPNHIEVQLAHLEKHQAAGCRWLNYYNLRLRAWRTMLNSCSALSNTAFHARHIDKLLAACDEAERINHYGVDRLFWRSVGADGLHDQVTVIGMKGMPGTPGIGIGHAPSAAWQGDPTGAKLRQWLGPAAESYLSIVVGSQP